MTGQAMTDLKKLAGYQFDVKSRRFRLILPPGEWVRYSDYVALQQEVETLREQLGHEATAYAGCVAQRDALQRVVARTRQETLEEAAKVCDQLKEEYLTDARKALETGHIRYGLSQLAAERCALAIRALQHTVEETKP